MYIFTAFIYKKNLQHLWKASRRHQTHSFLTSFVKFCRLSMTLSQAMLMQQLWNLTWSDCLSSFFLRKHFNVLWIHGFQVTQILKILWHLDLYLDHMSHVFSLFLYVFLKTWQNKTSVINYCKLKLSGKSRIFKSLPRTYNFFHWMIYSLLFYEDIYPTGSLDKQM